MNTIKIKELILENFGIYKDKTVLNFDGRDIVGILAKYHDSPTRSNRAGKSLIPEAIRYNLTGSLRYKKAAKMIYKGEDLMMVTCVYEDSQGTRYKVRRGVNSKGEGVLNLDWTEKTGESQKAIDELFGTSKDDFDLTLFFKQSEINGFMDLGTAKKTDHLMKWMDNEHWKRKEEAVKADVKILKEELRENDTTIKALTQNNELTENLESEIELLERQAKSASIKLSNSKAKKEVINKELILINQKSKEAKENIKSIKEKLQNFVTFKEEQKEAKDKFKKYKDKLQELSDSVPRNLKDYDSLIKEKADILASIRVEKENIKRSSEHTNGLCPILNESCDRIKPNKKDLEKRKDNVGKLQLKIEALEKDIEKCSIANEINSEITLLTRRMDKVKDILKRKMEVDVESEKNKLKEYEDSLDVKAIEERKEMISEFNDEISEFEGMISRFNQNAGALKEKLRANKEAEKKVETLYSKNKKLKSKLEILQYIQSMFSKHGIPADEIENSFKEVQDDINFLLKELKTDLTISFSPDKELGKWEEICHCGFKFPKGYRNSKCEECDSPRQKQRSDEISLKIIENGEESDFEGDSGGGKTLLSYAVRIALTLLKRRQNKCKLNVLFLDEVDSALDPHFSASITDSITKLLVKKLGYEQIIMISHKEEIKEAIPHIIQVTRYQDYSKAKFL